MKNNLEVIESQQKVLFSLVKNIVGPGSNYALIDFPDHSNIGDSAIWLGEAKLLKSITGKDPAYVCTIDSFDEEELRKALPEGPIFLHGGGNFGDIWPWWQTFRLKVLNAFKDRILIQLPQSISFSNSDVIAETAQVIKDHLNFLLMVRDQPSLELAQENFTCKTVLVPDMAFAIGPLDRVGNPSFDTYMLLRQDKEKVAVDFDILRKLKNNDEGDWPEEARNFRQSIKVKTIFGCLVNFVFNKYQARFRLYQNLAEARVLRGRTMLSTGKTVITDRLHAHILCVLMDIPHVTLDNNYGKISRYINAWTNGYPNVRKARNASEAVVEITSIAN